MTRPITKTLQGETVSLSREMPMTNPSRALAATLLLLSWNLAYLRADDAEDKAVKAIEALGGVINRDGPAKGPIVSINLIGTKTTDADLKILKNFKNLSLLYLGRTQVTDAGLKELKELKGLTVLGLRQTQVTAQGVKDLQDALPKCNIAQPRWGWDAVRQGKACLCFQEPKKAGRFPGNSQPKSSRFPQETLPSTPLGKEGAYAAP